MNNESEKKVNVILVPRGRQRKRLGKYKYKCTCKRGKEDSSKNVAPRCNELINHAVEVGVHTYKFFLEITEK